MAHHAYKVVFALLVFFLLSNVIGNTGEVGVRIFSCMLIGAYGAQPALLTIMKTGYRECKVEAFSLHYSRLNHFINCFTMIFPDLSYERLHFRLFMLFKTIKFF